MSRTNEFDGAARVGPHFDDLDLRMYWRILRHRRWLVLSVFAAVVALTLLVTLRQRKIYASSTTLIIEVSAPRVLDKDQVQDVVDTGTGSYWYSKEYYETQYKVITSRSVAQRVIDKLQLARDPRFLRLEAKTVGEELDRAIARMDPASELQARLRVLPVKDSRVVRIEVEDTDPAWAAALANAVAEAYIAENLSVRSTMTQNASEWLEEQLADLETKLAASADELFKFKQSHDIVATSWEDRQSMVTQRLVALNDALTRARVQRAQLESRSEQIESLGAAISNGDPASEAFAILNESRTIQDLKVRYFEARVDCADLRVRYLDEHPSVHGCDAKVAAAREGLAREVRTILEGARRQYDEAAQTERKLLALLNGTKSDAFNLNQYEKQYLELKRGYDNNQRLYEMVLKRLKDAGVSGMLQMSNVRILDRAEADKMPVSPRPIRNGSLAIVIGLLGGVALAFLIERLDTSITSREQVEEHLGVSFLGMIPTIESTPDERSRDLYVHGNPKSAAAECLRSIRANLLFMSPEKPLKTILVTSSGPSEGKTTTASSLAQIMADAGNRVLMVDADMRRPRAHEVFGVSREAGLSSLILGDGRLEDAIRATNIPNLFVLTCGPIPPNPNELLHTAAFSNVLEAVAARFDRVIIDSPPVGVVADAAVIGTQVDGTLVVLKAGQTSRDAAVRTVRTLTDVQARVFGAVLNDVDLDDERYGQYYQYYRDGYYGEAPARAAQK